MNTLCVLIGILGSLWLANFFYTTVDDTTLGFVFFLVFLLLLAWFLHAIVDDIRNLKGKEDNE